jgi:DNA-3-methyladenine glycosylase
VPAASGPRALSPEFYNRPVVEVARDLTGCRLSHAGVSGTIVETEAYHATEPACHAFIGRTARTETLFGSPGTAYVYRSYGIHSLVNAVCEPEGTAAAVLIRALVPETGIELMAERRRRPRPELTNGPGKLTEALGIDLSHNGTSLAHGPVRISAGPPASLPIVTGPRIGISQAVELPWRFALAGCSDVSRPRPR